MAAVIFPWPSRQEREARVREARARAEAARQEAAAARGLAEELRALRERNHVTEALDALIRRRMREGRK